MEGRSGGYLTFTGVTFGREIQWLAFALLIAVWITTAFGQVPSHSQPGAG